MADKRLADIRTSDDAESTVNVELIEWLKTSGVNYLLVILVVIIVARGFLWWGERRERIRDQAWADLASTDLAPSLESLADRVQGIDSVAELALLRACRLYLRDVLRDESLELTPETPTLTDPSTDQPDTPEPEPKEQPRMSERERTETLDRMERLYRRVLDSTASAGKEINGKQGLQLEAMFGLAAVAEMRGDFTAADEWFTRIESEAAERFPELAKVAAAWRADTAWRTPIEFYAQRVIDEALSDPKPQLPAGDASTEASPAPEEETPPAGGEDASGSPPSADEPEEGGATPAPTDKPDDPAAGGGR